MKLVLEIVSEEVLPTVRAIIGKKMVDQYGLSQKSAAERLGLTQPAISQYKRQLRGYRASVLVENEKVLGALDAAAKRFSTGNVQISDVAREFSEICNIIVSEGIAHKIHTEMGIAVGDCSFCAGNK